MHPNPGRAWRALFIGLAVGASQLMAGPAAPDQPATVIAVQVRGSVVVQHGTATETEKVMDGSQLGQADTITTAAQSSVMLVIPNGTVVALKENSRLKISVALQSALLAGEPPVAAGAEPAEPGVSQTGFELSFGEMLTRVRKLNPSSTFEVQTPVSVAAVRGTVFEISYQPGAKGDATYQLSTASGLVQVRPHTGKLVEVSANQQMSLRAEIGKNGIKIKRVKSGKLDNRKGERINREGMDMERSAGEFMQRVNPPGPGSGPGAGPNPNPQAAPGTPGANARGTAANQPNPPAGQPGNRDNSPGQPAVTAPPGNPPKAPATNAPKPPAVTPPTNRAGPPQVVKPNVPVAKPKVPARPPAIKRPPRPPGT